MKMVQGTVKDFINLFGQEGVKLANQHKVNVYLAKVGDFPEVDAIGEGISGLVAPVNPITREVVPQDLSGELAMILYPEAIRGSAQVLRDGAQEKGQALENKVQRYINSHLVHELTHVQQINKGRLTIIRFGLVEWEGALMEIGLNGYTEFPWEREAYIAQFAHMLGSRAKALKAYEQMVYNTRQATSAA